MKSNAERQARFRKAHPSYIANEAIRTRARNRALSQLAKNHRGEYSKLYNAELTKLQKEGK